VPRYDQEQVKKAKKIMKPFVLRRLKKDVLQELPKKTDIVQYCNMSPRQQALYSQLVSTYKSNARDGEVVYLLIK